MKIPLRYVLSMTMLSGYIISAQRISFGELRNFHFKLLISCHFMAEEPINVYSDYMITSLTPFRTQTKVTIPGLINLLLSE